MNSNGFPTWIKVIAQVGFPIAVSIYFMAVVYPIIIETKAQMKDHVERVSLQSVEIKEQTRLLKEICRSVAGTPFDKSNCDK